MGLQAYLEDYDALKTFPMDLGKILATYGLTTQKAMLSKFTIKQKILPVMAQHADASLTIPTLYYTIDAVLVMVNDPAGTYIPDFGDGKEILELFSSGMAHFSPGSAPEVMKALINHIDLAMKAVSGSIPVKLREFKTELLPILEQIKNYLLTNQEVAVGYAVTARAGESPVSVGNAVIASLSDSLKVDPNEDLRSIVFADPFSGLSPSTESMAVIDQIANAAGKAISAVQNGSGIVEGAKVLDEDISESVMHYLIEVRCAASNIRSLVTLCEETNCDMECELFESTTSEDCVADVPDSKLGWGDSSIVNGDKRAMRVKIDDIFSMNQISGKNIQYVLGSIVASDNEKDRRLLTEKLKNSIVETMKWEAAHENFMDIPVAHYVDTSIIMLETLTRNTKYAVRVEEAYASIMEGIKAAMEDGECVQGVFTPTAYTLNSITPFPVGVRASQLAFNNILKAQTDEEMDKAMFEFAKVYNVEENVFQRTHVEEGGATLTVRNLVPLLKNVAADALTTGKFDEIEGRLLKIVDSCKSASDIEYLRKDTNTMSLNKLRDKVAAVESGKSGGLDEKTRKSIEKRIKKGLTSKKLDKHIKWLNEVYKPALTKKAKELKNAISESEELFETSNKVTKAARDVSRKVQKGSEKAIRNVGGTAHELKQAAHNAVDPMEKYIGQMMEKIKKEDANKRREIIIKGGVLPKVLRWVKRSIPLIAGAAIGAHVVPAAAVASGIALIGFIASDKWLDAKEKRKILREIEDELEIVNEKIDDARGDSNKQKRYELIRIRNNLKRTKDRITYNLKE